MGGGTASSESGSDGARDGEWDYDVVALDDEGRPSGGTQPDSALEAPNTHTHTASPDPTDLSIAYRDWKKYGGAWNVERWIVLAD